MKKISIIALMILSVGAVTYGANTAFDSMDNAVEVKLSPAIKTAQKTSNNAEQATSIPTASNNIQVQKYNNALVNLDDAQVELRQNLADVTAKYNDALIEKDKAVQNCKALKKEIKAINKKMKNVDKSKKMINANLETGK